MVHENLPPFSLIYGLPPVTHRRRAGYIGVHEGEA
jgi:hypothetical protein